MGLLYTVKLHVMAPKCYKKLPKEIRLLVFNNIIW